MPIQITQTYTNHKLIEHLMANENGDCEPLRWLATLSDAQQCSVMNDVIVLCAYIHSMGPKSALELVWYIRTQLKPARY